jgi:DNA-binding response OmpR family regulator
MNTLTKHLEVKILIVDDQDENLFLLQTILSQIGYKVDTLNDSLEAMECLILNKYDLIILDVLMPNIDGFTLCKMIKGDKNLHNIPVMFISSLEQEKDIVKAFEVGAADYITKPIKKLEVIARVDNQLKYKMKYNSLASTMEFAFHELQTPINVIYNDIFLLEEKFGHTKNHTRINVALTILESIYMDLYYTIKKDDVFKNIEEIDFTALVETYLGYFETLKSNQNIQIRKKYSEVLKPLRCSKIALERLVSNTISNSLKYSKEGAEVIVEVATKEDKLFYKISNETDSKTDFNQFFKSGYKDLKNIQGLGIGLDIVRQIINDFKIDVNVVRDDKVLSFEFIIPSVDEVV